MIRLLCVDFRRLFRNRLFWSLMAACALLSALCIFAVNSFAFDSYPDYNYFCSYFLNYFKMPALFIPILLAVFLPLFIGTDRDSGTLRNKLISGNTRAAVCLSNLVVSVSAGVMLYAAFIAPYCGVLLPIAAAHPENLTTASGTDAPYYESTDYYISAFAVTVAIIIAAAAVITLVSLLAHSKAYAATVSLVLTTALIAVGVYFAARLNEPEFYESYSGTIGGEFVTEKEPNDNYVRPPLRDVLQAYQDISPYSQAVGAFIQGDMRDKTARLICFDLLVTFASAAAAVIVFRRTDIK